MQEKENNKKKHINNPFYPKLSILFGLAIIILVLYNSVQISSINPLFEQGLEEAKKAAIPAKVELVVISAQSCDDCYGTDKIIEVISSTGVNVTDTKEVDFSSGEGKALVEKYGIKKVPTLIITGEINRSRSLISVLGQMGEEAGEGYVITRLIPPFVEVSTGTVKGIVSLTHLKKDNCDECYNLSPIIDQLSQVGMKIGNLKEIDINTKEGKALIKKYDIQKAPVIIINNEVEAYPEIVNNLAKIVTRKDDGVFVTQLLGMPYYDIQEKKVKGLVKMTVILDESCSECYNPDDFHKVIFQKMGIAFKEEKRIDISSPDGKDIIEKYNIEKVPTILVTGDIEEYPGLISSWGDVGTVESDGVYVFRKLEVVELPYKDLSTNKVINPIFG